MIIHTRPMQPDERDRWLSFRERLWPESPSAELAREMDELLNDPQRAVVIFATDATDVPIGFAEVSRRDWAEGCARCAAGVGYVEAWFVESEHRRRGVGTALLAAAEAWAAGKGCREMASDADVDNTVSIDAHRAAGYVEQGRAVLFRKTIRR